MVMATGCLLRLVYLERAGRRREWLLVVGLTWTLLPPQSKYTLLTH